MNWRSRLGLLGFVAAVVAVGAWEGSRQLRSRWVTPEAILVLGGAEEREHHAARMASEHPELDVWVSSGSPRWYAERVFARAGVALTRVHLDYRALDTVTNFTTLADELQAKGIESVYLVTSDRHMLRALVVGEIVFGSRGILLKPASVPSQRDLPAEPQKAARDGLRALVWLLADRAKISSVDNLRPLPAGLTASPERESP